ncbi:MAG TPA: PH domain-containing protein [Candidatus Binatia bacterium]|nr:PH domain-containing protein [Candidatus Binatia bacterium]
MDEERTLWEGTPSQIINLPIFILCALVAGALIGAAVLFHQQVGTGAYAIGGAAVVPLFIGFWKWLRTRSTKYHLTTERLHVTRGIFSRRTEDLELYRVKDYHIYEPFTMRLFGLADIVLNTTDDANATIFLKAIPDGKGLRDQVRKHVELCRDRKRVRINEIET